MIPIEKAIKNHCGLKAIIELELILENKNITNDTIIDSNIIFSLSLIFE